MTPSATPEDYTTLTDVTRRQRSEELQQLIAPDRFGDNHASRSFNAIDLKNVLGQIEPNGRDR